MILCRKDILKLLEEGKMRIEPFDDSLLGNDSLDVRLGGEILIFKKVNEVVDLNDRDSLLKSLDRVTFEESVVIKPHIFFLASTFEKISLPPNVAAYIEGRSSLGRLGIMVHVTAGVVHAGFGIKEPSSITLEMFSFNPNPVRLYKGMRIAQLVFHKLSCKDEPYDNIGKYVSQKGPTPPF